MKQKHILIIDDEKDILEILSDIISDLDYSIITAQNGKAALEIIEKNKFDIVLSDIQMPVMNGVDFFKQIKSTYPTHFKKFIFMTGYAEIDRQEALRLGADDFISKPIDIEFLLKILR